MSNNTLGERIKFHRTRLRMTQEQLAERMGVSAQAVSKWEHDQSCPDISILPDLAELFGISVDELLGKTAQQTVHKAEVVEEKSSPSIASNWGVTGKKSGLCFALFIVTLGGLMLLNRICDYDVSFWSLVWTLGLVFIGASGLSQKFSLFSLTLCIAGVYFLLSKYELFSFSLEWEYLFPALLLLWGVSLLVDIFRGDGLVKVRVQSKADMDGKPRYECDCTDGYLHCDLSFGTHREVVSTELLKGAEIDANFGQFTVDFSACKAVTPDCTIKVDQNFGSLTLLIPKIFAVEINDNDEFLASAEIEGSPAAITYGTIHLQLDNSFGALKIRYTE